MGGGGGGGVSLSYGLLCFCEGGGGKTNIIFQISNLTGNKQ